MKPTSNRDDIIGWREWVQLPGLGIRWVKAKIDSGARSSSLHAFHIREVRQDGKEYVKFRVHPRQRSVSKTVHAMARVVDFRDIRSSSGHSTIRPVIVTEVVLLGECWSIELTLADRTEMGFRMLMGREAIRGRFLIDTNRSYYGGKPPRKKKRKPKHDE